MDKHCGLLRRVGSLSGGDLMQPTDTYGNTRVIGSYRTATEIDSIEIGDTVLKKPNCEEALFENLQPGRQACLYVYRNGRRPILVGVKYDNGEKFLVTGTYLRGSILQMVILLSFMYGIGGVIAGGIVGSVIGLDSYTPAFGVLCGAAAGLMWWWRAWQFFQAYQLAKAD
jgi:hypothetical protein